jgi:predicted RNA-binding Zn-ribbon protein involved in translation (DUF1610 family)
MKQKITQQIKAYKLDISQTNSDGSFRCPHCGIKISPDDHSEATYTLYDTKLKDNNIDEVVIYCKNCLTFIHLGGFFELCKKTRANLTALYA